jgi:two-component system, OmpR family, phosphate regulon sensor histidine kinase PhoR
MGARLLSRLSLRLTLGLLGVATLGMLVMGLYVTRALERHTVESLKVGLVTSARLVHDLLLPPGGQLPGAEPMQRLVERYAATLGTRVTVIAADGTVLGDSEREPAGVPAMENHAGRPEVQAALGGGIGSDVRRSRTLGVDMLYVAVPLEGPSRPRGAVRLAVPLTEVAKASASIRQAVAIGAILAIAVVLGVGAFLSRRVTWPVARMQAIAQRMAAGDFEQRVPAAGDDEVAELGHALNRMALALRDKVQTLEAERAEVAAILERMVEGVVALDERGRILLMNPGARAIFDLPDGAADRVAGRSLLETVRQKPLFDLVEACRAGAPPEGYRREVELGPPVNRILAAHAVPVSFAQGTGVVLVLHDVTELRRLERVRAEFVANVSHELRTPLTSIKGYLETLLDGALDDPAHARRFLETAHVHAERLGRLVDDLLQLSDVETGKVALRLEPICLRELAGAVATMFEPQAAHKGLVVLNEVPAALAVHGDADRLSQILVNLVDNGVKYTPAGGRITLSAVPGPAGMVEVAVADTGIGIPSLDLPRITERFYRVDKARSRELGGTGLGLAIVKHLVQAHGGTLMVESALGKGTTVRFTLPSA